jgi:hypothetical protein
MSTILRIKAGGTQQPTSALSWSEDFTHKHWRDELFTYVRSVSGMNEPALNVRS